MTIVALAALAAACGHDGGAPAERAAAEVRAVRVAGDLPRTDPGAAAWRDAPELVTKLLLQDVTEPRLRAATTDTVSVRALTDGEWLAVRVEWADDHDDTLGASGRFSDAAAIQLPAVASADLPDPAMGEPAGRVLIRYWRAAWQEEGDPVERLRPNATTDHYPYEAAAAGSREGMERSYAPAKAVGNPIARPPGGSPVQALVAEGYGTLSPDPEGRAEGRGRFADGRWAVVIAVPLGATEADPLRAGGRTRVAFAVWDGDAGHVGSRKMRTAWVPLAIEAAP
jgi:hypothetical protein